MFKLKLRQPFSF